MVITFVVDQYLEGNNGTTMTIRRFSEELMKRGHEVRILCGKGSGKEKIFETGEAHYPFKGIIHSEGMLFGKYDKNKVLKALEGTDIVHFVLPFHMERKIKKLCDKLNIPSTSAFHCQPENITSTIFLGQSRLANNIFYRRFRRFYNKFTDIHCPSEMTRFELLKHHYKSNLHVISNGITDFFHKVDSKRPENLKNKFIIVNVGRYSREKRQDLIINAVKNSKYESKIQLIFAGQGPLLNKYKKLCKGLTNKPILGLHSQEELREIHSYSDLYVHSSDAEIEGMGCTEALACGLVPIISDSKKSATGQFALCEESLFNAGNYLNLRDKIDYLIENEDLRNELSEKYVEEAKKYLLSACVDKFEDMLAKKLLEKKI